MARARQLHGVGKHRPKVGSNARITLMIGDCVYVCISWPIRKKRIKNQSLCVIYDAFFSDWSESQHATSLVAFW